MNGLIIESFRGFVVVLPSSGGSCDTNEFDRTLEGTKEGLDWKEMAVYCWGGFPAGSGIAMYVPGGYYFYQASA